MNCDMSFTVLIKLKYTFIVGYAYKLQVLHGTKNRYAVIMHNMYICIQPPQRPGTDHGLCSVWSRYSSAHFRSPAGWGSPCNDFCSTNSPDQSGPIGSLAVVKNSSAHFSLDANSRIPGAVQYKLT